MSPLDMRFLHLYFLWAGRLGVPCPCFSHARFVRMSLCLSVSGLQGCNELCMRSQYVIRQLFRHHLVVVRRAAAAAYRLCDQTRTPCRPRRLVYRSNLSPFTCNPGLFTPLSLDVLIRYETTQSRDSTSTCSTAKTDQCMH